MRRPPGLSNQERLLWLCVDTKCAIAQAWPLLDFFLLLLFYLFVGNGTNEISESALSDDNYLSSCSGYKGSYLLSE